jgi:hypothetical protein
MNNCQNIMKKMLSQTSIQKTAHYIPPVSIWRPIKDKKNSSVRVACIVDDYIYDGLQFEGEILLITESNWKSIIDYGDADFLLMNSFIESATGDWHMSQLSSLNDFGLLGEVLAYAKSCSIPTVYWFTKDHKYHEHFNKITKLFDYVFCADPEELSLLSSSGVKANLLLPCVQPALFNPFRKFEDYDSLKIELLVDGWADLDRYPDLVLQLKPFIDSGLLKIIESNYVITKNRVEASVECRQATLGYVTGLVKQSILKYAQIFLGLTPTIQDDTERVWSYLSVAASRVCILHMGDKLRVQQMNNLVLQIKDFNSLTEKLKWFDLDPLIREKFAHMAWREANLKHTFSHRVKTICEFIGINNDWDEFPKVSLIFPSYRPDYVERCISTYEKQVYENKEMILVLNIDCDIPNSISDKINAIPGAIALQLPQNCFAGDCINYGIKSSSGKYVFRIDDDDYYAQNYILDRVLTHRSLDMDFIANPHTLFFYFEENNNVYLRKTKSQPFVINPIGEFPTKFTGNSYSGKRTLFEQNPFKSNNYSAADVYFLDNLPENTYTVSADYFNMAAERRVDQTTHTWRLESQEKLKSNESLFAHYKCVAC